MSSVGENYSDYVGWARNMSGNYVTLAGFAFTTLTLLLALLPDPSQMFAQVALLSVMFMFDLLGFLASWVASDLIYFCREIPPLTKADKIFNYLAAAGLSFTGLVPGLMFLVKNLTHLALVSWFIWILFVVALYEVCWKQVTAYRATRGRWPAWREKAVRQNI